MDKKKILQHLDHTLLKQDATWEQIKTLCDEGMQYHVASVCIPPCYVKEARDYVADRLKICTVIGFPNGYQTTAAKVAETKEAVEDGADEIDMVININRVKDDRFEEVLQEVKEIRAACEGKVLKVIIETCLLTDTEKIRMCEVVTAAKADFIKTSTGFSKAGATFDDIALFASHVGENVQIKAAGGISSFADADEFVKLGADRLGTSRIVKIVKNENASANEY